VPSGGHEEKGKKNQTKKSARGKGVFLLSQAVFPEKKKRTLRNERRATPHEGDEEQMVGSKSLMAKE